MALISHRSKLSTSMPINVFIFVFSNNHIVSYKLVFLNFKRFLEPFMSAVSNVVVYLCIGYLLGISNYIPLTLFIRYHSAWPLRKHPHKALQSIEKLYLFVCCCCPSALHTIPVVEVSGYWLTKTSNCWRLKHWYSTKQSLVTIELYYQECCIAK